MGETLEWIDPDGDVTVLDVEWGASGRFAPPAELFTAPIPLGAGSVLQHVRHAERTMVLPLFIDAADAVTLRQTTRALVRALDPLRGEGKLRDTAPDGTVRSLSCRCVDGLQLGETWGHEAGEIHQRAAARFLATDPYWYEVEPFSQVYRLPEETVPFFPFLPLVLAPSNVLENQRVSNTGDVEAWPVWTITGPADSVTITLAASGVSPARSLVMPAGLLSSEVVVIDTRPLIKSVVDDSGANRFGDLTLASSLFSLRPGTNDIDLQVDGANLDTSVVLTFQRRYLTP